MDVKKGVIIACIGFFFVICTAFGFRLLFKSMETTRFELAESRRREQQYEELYNESRRELTAIRAEAEESRRLLGTIRAETNNVRESLSRNGETITEIREITKDLQNYYSRIEQCINNDRIAINR